MGSRVLTCKQRFRSFLLVPLLKSLVSYTFLFLRLSIRYRSCISTPAFSAPPCEPVRLPARLVSKENHGILAAQLSTDKLIWQWCDIQPWHYRLGILCGISEVYFGSLCKRKHMSHIRHPRWAAIRPTWRRSSYAYIVVSCLLWRLDNWHNIQQCKSRSIVLWTIQ